MRIRAENVASMTDRLKGIRHEEPVTFIDWQVGVFATGAQFRLLVPALNRPPKFSGLETTQHALPSQHESDARDASGLETKTTEAA